MFDYNLIKENFTDNCKEGSEIKREPFIRFGYLYATNGRILIRVKVEDVSNLPSDVPVKEDITNVNVSKVIEYIQPCDSPDITYDYDFLENMKKSKQIECSHCHGKGVEPEECECCDGKGFVELEYYCQKCNHFEEIEHECHNCHGDGYTFSSHLTCKYCDGSKKEYQIIMNNKYKMQPTNVYRLKLLKNVLINETKDDEKPLRVFKFTDDEGKCEGRGIFMVIEK